MVPILYKTYGHLSIRDLIMCSLHPIFTDIVVQVGLDGRPFTVGYPSGLWHYESQYPTLENNINL